MGPDSLSVVALGGLRIVRDGEEIRPTAWPRLKCRRLFAYLLCARPRGAHKEVLCQLLWPDASAMRAAHALQVTLSDLRAALGGADRAFIARDGERYHLGVGPSGSVDVEVFEGCIEEARRAEDAGALDAMMQALHGAESLYGGELLAGEPGTGWAVARRAHLREAFVNALLRLGRGHEAAGHLEIAADYTRKVLTADPCREPAYRDLMRYQKAFGDHAGVVRTYLRCQEALRQAFDAEVAPQTRALAEVLMGRAVDDMAIHHWRTRPA